MNLKKRVVSIALTLTVAATMLFVPTVSFAASDYQWKVPTEPMKVDDNIVKVAGHAANSTCVHFLGGDLITDRASDVVGRNPATSDQAALDYARTVTEIGVFGTDANQKPDPYWWNYFYNLYAKANGKTTTTPHLQLVNANPMGADLTEVDGYQDLTVDGSNVPHSVGMKPDIMLGINGSNGKDYNTYIAKMKDAKVNGGNWDPIQVAYKAKDLNDFIDDMYNLSDAIKQSGKTGRYGDTEVIAKNYEEYVKGLQLYVMSQIDAGKVKKKTVAIIDPNVQSDGTYQAYDSSMAKGTAASCRAAEYVENTTNNIIETCNIPNTGDSSNAKYSAEVKDIMTADAIYITVQAQINLSGEEVAKQLAEKAGCDVKDVPPIYAYDPNGVFSIRANSVDNCAGIGMYQGFLYPEVINPVYATEYTYDKFYHLNSSVLSNVTETLLSGASLPEGYTADASGYSASYIESRINTGLAYYYSNKSKYEDTKLAPTERLSPDDYSFTDASTFKVSTISNKTYNGKAQKPSVTVKAGSTTLVKDKDYTVSYKNNVKPGKATVTITGKHTYKGTKKVTFKIVPKKQAMSKATSPKKAQLKATWKKDSTVTGYQVVIAKNKSFTSGKKTATITKNKTVSKTFTKLSKGKKYYVKVRAYKSIDGKKYYGNYSSYKTVKVRK